MRCGARLGYHRSGTTVTLTAVVRRSEPTEYNRNRASHDARWSGCARPACPRPARSDAPLRHRHHLQPADLAGESPLGLLGTDVPGLRAVDRGRWLRSGDARHSRATAADAVVSRAAHLA